MRLPIVALLVTLLASAGCPGGCQVPTGGQAIQCGSEAIEKNWHKALPKVNACLTMATGWEGCLIGLIEPAVGITEDVIACLVKDQGAKFADTASANPSDATSKDGAAHAAEFLQKRGYKFE